MSDNIFSCFIENDNHRIISSLKKIIKIYSEYLRKKLLYYFNNYRCIVTKISINEINGIDTNSSIPFAISNIEPMPMHYYNTTKISQNTNINNDIYIPKLNSSIAYSLVSENNKNFGNKTERINNRIILDKKTTKKRRTLSFGNLEVKINDKNGYFNNFGNENYNNNDIFKAPPFTCMTPNKYIYPIYLNNNNNNGMNKSLLYQYPGNTVVYQNDSKNEQSKPLLWYTNAYSSISPISFMQDNNYLNSFQNQTPRYINNSAYFNSITNINNSYSEDYLNKQIFNFINANSKTKKSIISEIGKKHNIKLSKTKKINEKNIKSKEKFEKNRKDKILSNNKNKQIIFEKMKNKSHSEFHDLNNERFQNENIVVNKFKTNKKLKIKNVNNSYTLKKQIPCGQKKRSIINNLKSKNINLDRNKIIKNYSIEISYSGQIINNSDYLYENNAKANNSINFYNKNETNKENQYSYKMNNDYSNHNNNIVKINNLQGKEEDKQNSSYENLKTSLQSINDSKMIEMANNFVEEDKLVSKDTINEILNEKYNQRLKKTNNKNF